MSFKKEIFIDNFAGGGGASTGIEMAIGRSVDIAINHDPDAIAMHTVNHPDSKHYCEDVWHVDPHFFCLATEGLLYKGFCSLQTWGYALGEGNMGRSAGYGV